jgi:hypothetical protein
MERISKKETNNQPLGINIVVKGELIDYKEMCEYLINKYGIDYDELLEEFLNKHITEGFKNGRLRIS